jgi:NADH:ubiquinone oxidoreductase subunit K
MVVVVQCVHHNSAFLKGKIAHLFILCGQHSPQIFCLGILLSVTGHFVLSELHGGIPTQITINITGVVAMLGTALLLEWYKNAEKEPPQLPAEEPVPPLRRAA